MGYDKWQEKLCPKLGISLFFFKGAISTFIKCLLYCFNSIAVFCVCRRDSSLVKEEIKAFLGNRRISQAVVAQVTGISQSRISHWLLQHGSDLSEQKKRAFYRWYILEKTTPGT
ncbi:hypothetical protein XENOCAPTIV_023735 [Xenoophorus captivus]|uniref:POU-specific atypical domain-containing protein n=1 Tax=Xenoophorus captivus TaxID=1517983 RepID=A0ABV0RBH7_9TELE